MVNSPARGMSLQTLQEDTPLAASKPLDVVEHYKQLLKGDDSLSMPIAAVETLAELIAHSDSTTTTTELFTLLRTASSQLAAASFNPISLSAGTSLFLRFLTLQRPPPDMSFAAFKSELVERAREFVAGSGRCRELIANNMADFIVDGSTILVHSYSRVVVQALLHAAKEKKRFSVYVTESRPFGLGLKTQAILEAAGVPAVVVLDSAVCYIMPKVDMAIVGAEAVCESGGIVNFIGGYSMAVMAKFHGKPLYALAESFKFTRLFPLAQYDLPSSLASPPLSFPTPNASAATSCKTSIPATPSRPMIDSSMPEPLEMSDEQARSQPTLDYTTPDLVALIVSDLGLCPTSGVTDTLLAIYAGQ